MFCRKNSVYRDLLKEEGAIVHPEIKNLFSVRNILSGSAERIMDANNWYWKPKAAKALESAPVGVSKLFTTKHELPTRRWRISKNGHDVDFSTIIETGGCSLYASVFPEEDNILSSGLFPRHCLGYRAVVQHGDKRYLHNRHGITKLYETTPYTGDMGMNYTIGDYTISPMFCVNGLWKFANDLSIYELGIVRAEHELTEDAARLLKRRQEILEKS